MAELKMLKFSLDVTRKDGVRNYYSERVQLGRFGDKVRGAKLGWFGHLRQAVQLLDKGH